MAREGEQLGRYRIEGEVGAGGMSVVHRARDTTLGREVALKVLHPHLANKAEARARFTREARAVARLKHPNILEIHDFSGEEAGEAFIVTELIRGTTLRAFAEAHPLRPPEVAAMAGWLLADALAHAHGIGVIHRDLKPENVMVADDGRLKLTDFGIAKILEGEERMTLTGALVGSPAHMAPEVIEGDEATAASDLFSLGTVLYWMVVGRLPFVGANTTATLKRILDGAYEDPRVAEPRCPDALADVIARCLTVDPKARLPSAAMLREELGALLNEVGIARPEDEWARFVGDPIGASSALTARIETALLALSEAQVAQGRRTAAMATLGRLLALAPKHPGAQRQLELLRNAARRRLQLERTSWVIGLLLFLGLLFVGFEWAWNLKPEAQVQVEPPPERSEPKPVVAVRPEPTPEPVAVIPTRPDPETDGVPGGTGVSGSVRPSPGVEPGKVVPTVRPVIAPVAPPGTVLIVPRPFADITIDGKRLATGSPSFLATLSPGTHTVQLTNENSVAETLQVEVPSGGHAPDVRVRLSPLPARLRVDNRQNAGVLVDGKLLGTAEMSRQSPFLLPMPAGPGGQALYRARVRVTLTKPGLKDLVVEQEITAGELAVVQRELEGT